MSTNNFFQVLSQSRLYPPSVVQRLAAEWTEIKEKRKRLGFSINNHPVFKKQMCCFEGVIVIVYKAKSYNIPVSIWIPNGYPQYPPLVQVVPTSTMVLKQDHRYMDLQGIVHHTLLSHWNPEYHSIATIIQVLELVFSEEPPVFAKSSSIQQTQVSQPHNFNMKPSSIDDSTINAVSNQKTSLKGLVRSKWVASTSSSNIPAQLLPKSSHVSSHPNVQAPYASPYSSVVTLTAEETQRRKVVQNATEIIKGHLDGFKRDSTMNISQLLEKRTQLRNQQESFVKDISQIKEEREVIENELNETQTIYNDLNAWIEAERPRLEKLDIDQFRIFPTTLESQSQKLVSKDLACQDALLLLDEFLQDGLITLEQFFKEIRKLAKEQYLLRCCLRRVHMLETHDAHQTRDVESLDND